MDTDDIDPTIRKAKSLFDKSGKSLDEVGLAMGYPEETARQSVWQFFNKTNDPRMSTLRRFAKAMGIPIRKLIE